MISYIGSGNGLVPSGNKPSPEPMLAQIYVAIWRHQATISLSIKHTIKRTPKLCINSLMFSNAIIVCRLVINRTSAEVLLIKSSGAIFRKIDLR